MLFSIPSLFSKVINLTNFLLFAVYSFSNLGEFYNYDKDFINSFIEKLENTSKNKNFDAIKKMQLDFLKANLIEIRDKL